MTDRAGPPKAPSAAPATDEIVWDRPDPFVWSITVAPEHIDMFGHTNNVVYLRFMAITAWEHSKALGLDFEAYQRFGKGMVVRRHELDYLAATFVDEELAFATWITRNDGRLRLRRRFQLFSRTRGITVLRGLTDFVSIDLETGKPTRMPPEFKTVYAVTATWDTPEG